MNSLKTIQLKAAQLFAKIMSFITWENITLISLYIGLPFVVWAYTDWRLSLLTVIAVNFALFFYYTKKGNN